MVRERLRLYREAGITLLRVGLPDDDLDARLSSLARLLGLARDLDREE